jgi:gliding motility-associated-like protein
VKPLRNFTTILFCLAFACLPFSLLAQMEFVENKGQWVSDVKFQAQFTTGAFFLENKGFTVKLQHPDDVRAITDAVHPHAGDSMGARHKSGTDANGNIRVRSFAYKVRLIGANANAPQIPDKPLNSHNNYFIGTDPAKWAADCKIFQAVTYKEIYPNIDVRYYSGANGQLKYDFIVRPGGNPDFIAMEYIGPLSIKEKDKELLVETSVGTVRELYPYTYQSGSGKNEFVECRYVVKGNTVSFKLGKYDPSQTLIIDPSIIFSSFTGSAADNWGYTATPGADGSLFAGGISFGQGYPVSTGAYDQTFNGGSNEEGGINPIGYDMAIFKFNSTGSSRLYATYIGGASNEQPHSLIADAQGNLVIAGRSNSSNYPTLIPRIGPGGLYDIVVSKLNPSGSALVGSLRIGGTGHDGVNIRPKYPSTAGSSAISLRRNYGDDARSEVMFDGAGNIYLASSTQSSGTFPTSNAAQNSFGGGLQDGVVLKFTPNLGSVLFSTYFGGNGDDACFVLNLNPINNDLYVAGATASTNLPGSRTGVISGNFNGSDADGFVTIMPNTGASFTKTTYLGTTAVDLVYGLKFDRQGYPYVMGTSTGSWPIINATFKNAGSKQFIAKLRPDLSAYIYSTVFGTASTQPNISPIAFLVDRCENVYVSGWGGGLNNSQSYSTGNTFGLPEVNPLPGIPAADGNDLYFFVLERDATSQLFGSHFGQNGGLGDHVDGGTSRFDDNGVIYQAICANCTGNANFPTTPGAWATRNGSSSCNQAVVKIEMNFAGVGAAVQASINGVKNDSIGCIPLKVNFADTLRKGKTFYWNFGDNSPVLVTTTNTTSYVYNNVGTYLVMLIAEDSSTCNIRDTSYVTITAGNNEANLDFNFAKLPPCESLTMQFTNTSSASIGSFGPRSFVWDYGDGSPLDTAGLTPPRIHTYAATGTYLVKLILIDPTFCNYPDTVIKEVRINSLVVAQFETDSLGCAPYTAKFNNTSLAGTDFLWEFGDNTTSTDIHPTHTYNTPGIYNVRLIARDTSTCNKVDTSAYFTIRVESKPTALFNWSPNPPVENTPVQFTNLSSGAIRYLWNFGDGESSTQTNPSHQYQTTGTHRPELIAYSVAGCTDTFRLDVEVIIVPLLDVPNAFTPAKGGVNSIIRVAGFGIGKMQWRIYNRQGLLMYQTNSTKEGWNGTYKGKLQPMDVYAYTLDVEFTDGKKLRKTGDITLLR